MTYERGFGAIAAIVVLVIMAALAAVMTSISTTQQVTSAQDLQSARAWQAARAGNEWGMYQALHGGDWGAASSSCNDASRSRTLDLSATTGFYVTVNCDSWVYDEGESPPGTSKTVRVYRIEAIACPVAAGCPVVSPAPPAAPDNAVLSPGYVERRRVVLVTDTVL